jgi:hypothetical protein
MLGGVGREEPRVQSRLGKMPESGRRSATELPSAGRKGHMAAETHDPDSPAGKESAHGVRLRGAQ